MPARPRFCSDDITTTPLAQDVDERAVKPRGRPKLAERRTGAEYAAARRDRVRETGGAIVQAEISPEAAAALAGILATGRDASTTALVERLILEEGRRIASKAAKAQA